MPVLSSSVRDHAALPRMSVNADFSTPLKYLASPKKSIGHVPQHTTALELLVFCFFRILLVYPCALYYGMLIIGVSVSEPHTSEQCGKKFFVSYVRTYVLVLVLITPKSLPALILRVLASFVNSKTIHQWPTVEGTNRRTSSMATVRTKDGDHYVCL